MSLPDDAPPPSGLSALSRNEDPIGKDPARDEDPRVQRDGGDTLLEAVVALSDASAFLLAPAGLSPRLVLSHPPTSNAQFARVADECVVQPAEQSPALSTAQVATQSEAAKGRIRGNTLQKYPQPHASPPLPTGGGGGGDRGHRESGNRRLALTPLLPPGSARRCWQV